MPQETSAPAKGLEANHDPGQLQAPRNHVLQPPTAELARKRKKKDKDPEALLDLDGAVPSSRSTLEPRAKDQTSSKKRRKSETEPSKAMREAQPSKQPGTVRTNLVGPGSGEPNSGAGLRPLAEPLEASRAVKKCKGTVENGAFSAPASVAVESEPEIPAAVSKEPAQNLGGPRSAAFDPNSEEYYTPEGAAERKRVKREKRALRRQKVEAPGAGDQDLEGGLQCRGTGEGQPAPQKLGTGVVPAQKTVSSGSGSNPGEEQQAGGPAGGQQDKGEKKKRKTSRVDRQELISGPGNAAEAMAIRQKLGALPRSSSTYAVPPCRRRWPNGNSIAVADVLICVFWMLRLACIVYLM